MACGEKLAHVGVAAAIEREQQHLVRPAGDRAAEQRHESLGARALVEADRQVEVVAIGERQGAVVELERPLHQRLG